MIRRNTWIVLILFAVVLAAALFWQQTKQRKEGSLDAEPTPVSRKVIDVDEASIVSLTLQDAERNTVILERDQEGQWQLSLPKAEATDSSAVDTAVNQLLGLTASTTLDSTTPLEDLGLAKPHKRILLILDDGSQVIVNVGKPTPTGSGYYVLTNDSYRKILVVGKYGLDGFLGLLTDPPIQPTPTPTAEPTLEETPAP